MADDLADALRMIPLIQDEHRDYRADEAAAVLDLGHAIGLRLGLEGRAPTPDERRVLDTGRGIRQSDGPTLADVWVAQPGGGDMRSEHYLGQPAAG